MELPGSPTETRIHTAGWQGAARQGQVRQQGRARQGKAGQGRARQGKAGQGRARQGYSNRELTSAPARRCWSMILNVFCFVKAQPHNRILQRETRKTL